MTNAIYRLHRTGQFTVRTEGQFHCGTTPVLAIKYDALVTCPVSGLDSRGFLFDQVAVDRWFQAQAVTSLSCENYAAYCGRELYKLIRRENAGLVPDRIQLTLSPSPFAAEITFEWVNDGKRVEATVTTRPVQMRAQNHCLDLAVGLFQ